MAEAYGEAIGTFILVFFGCGSVAVVVLYGHCGLGHVALVWGIGLTLAIYCVRHLSCAHLNPAVTVAMAVAGRMTWKKVPYYLLGQFAGAFFAAAMVYVVYSGPIAEYETVHGIVRGTAQSLQTAKIFGEFYLVTSSSDSMTQIVRALVAEALGTFLLVFAIFALTEGCNVGRPHHIITPVFIGAVLVALISLFGPLTQAGFNPARDLAPRLLSVCLGWGETAFPDRLGGFVMVYVLGPLAGAISASWLFTRAIAPIMVLRGQSGDCCSAK